MEIFDLMYGYEMYQNKVKKKCIFLNSVKALILVAISMLIIVVIADEFCASFQNCGDM